MPCGPLREYPGLRQGGGKRQLRRHAARLGIAASRLRHPASSPPPPWRRGIGMRGSAGTRHRMRPAESEVTLRGATLGTTAKHERTTHDRNNLVWRPREAAERTAMNAAGTQTGGAGSMDPPKGPEEPRPFVARYATAADAATMRGAHRCGTSAPGSRERTKT